MTKTLALIVFLLVSLMSFSQNTVEGTMYSHFQLTLKKDTIDFVVADTNLSINKPLLLFCQGSQPVPLFFDLGERLFPSALSNFDMNELNKHYHVAVISMP